MYNNNSTFLNHDLYSLTNYFGFGIPGNEKMLSIVILYVEMMSILLAIAMTIFIIIIYTVFYFHGFRNRFPFHFSNKVESMLDIIFALIPTVIVTYILIPALGFLFQIEYDESYLETLFDVYVVGHQWYWTYEIDTKLGNSVLVNFFDPSFTFPVLQFDSYMSQETDVNRLLSVDKSLVLPSGYNICLYITSNDVIHSWSVPKLGIKLDAIPGRMMKCILYASVEGVYYGQCSELCGVNHAFMPICVEVVKGSYFIDWLFLSLDVLLTQEIDNEFLNCFGNCSKQEFRTLFGLDDDKLKSKETSCVRGRAWVTIDYIIIGDLIIDLVLWDFVVLP
jgi:heme/copper-type cytochrome/quinol oxidase subunit 2